MNEPIAMLVVTCIVIIALLGAWWSVMSDSVRVKKARELLEEWDAIAFVATERGYGAEEIDSEQARIWLELGRVLGANATCCICGAKIGGWYGVNYCYECLEQETRS